MNQTSLSDDLRSETDDKLDRVLSDFFKAQMPRAWAPPTTIALNEPSSLASRTASRHDSAAKSRYTLAVSVALLLGTCWYLSTGFAPRVGENNRPGPASPMLGGSSAGNSDVLKEIRKDKAGKDIGKRPKIEMP